MQNGLLYARGGEGARGRGGKGGEEALRGSKLFSFIFTKGLATYIKKVYYYRQKVNE